MKTLVLLFIFTTILCLFYAIFLLFFEHRYTVKNRMIHTGKFLDRYEAEEAKQQNSMLKGMLQQAVKNIEKSNYYAKIKTKLLQAYIKMKPIEFIESFDYFRAYIG